MESNIIYPPTDDADPLILLIGETHQPKTTPLENIIGYSDSKLSYSDFIDYHNDTTCKIYQEVGLSCESYYDLSTIILNELEKSTNEHVITKKQISVTIHNLIG